jgi:GNAT superfamily N-acetyltransferase
VRENSRVRVEGEPPIIRHREDADLEACASIARAIRACDGYPSFLPDDDYAAFVSPANALGAWVAVLGHDIVGHVAVRTSSAPSATELVTAALGIEPAAFAFVSRLMVLPRARRRGIARCLLGVAAAEIRGLGLTPVLDVLADGEAAIALYEREGWRRLGETRFRSRSGTEFDEVVFLAPEMDD